MRKGAGEETAENWYGRSMEHLVAVAQDLSEVRDTPGIARIVSDAGTHIVGSDGATFVLRDGDEVVCVEVFGTDHKWKGGRAPLGQSITGKSILTREPQLIEDIRTHPDLRPEVYQPGGPVSMVVMPIRKSDPIGAIVLFWMKSHRVSDEELRVLQALADITSVTWENVRLFNDLQDKIRSLEVQAIRIREQNESLEVFTHALAHDLKEPVRTVRAFSDLIAEGEAGDNEALYFDFIRKAAGRMGMLIDTVYTYTQLHDPSRAVKQPCDAAEILRGAQDGLRQLISQTGATIEARALPVVDANPGQLHQVLQNLIANAVKHTDGPAHIRINAADEGSHWHFTVADDGPGIAEGDLQRIFQPFKRLKLNEEGAGLGLAICAKIIAMHGGRIWCESDSQGAVFHFTLPKATHEIGAVETGGAMDKTPAGDAVALARVLLVDDREADLELTRILLRDRDKAEFDLNVARSGREALDMLHKARVGGERYDLMLLDINMPGMDGFETLEALRREGDFADITVVMCTGSTQDSDLEQARKLGAAGYMVKPASLAQLRPMLESVPALRWHDEGPAARLLRVA